MCRRLRRGNREPSFLACGLFATRLVTRGSTPRNSANCARILFSSVFVLGMYRAEVRLEGGTNMAVLKRIDPASAFKVGLATYAVVGLVAGVFCGAIALAGISFGPHARMPWAGSLGLLAVVVCPIVYGLIGGIAAVVSALIYNLAARFVGGLAVEIN